MKVELVLRRSGKTTGGILEAIGQAVSEPGATYYYVDEVSNRQALNWQLALAKDLISKLDLNVEVQVEGNSLAFKSLHKPVYSGSDGHLYMRV